MGFSLFGKPGKYETNPYGAWNPEQVALDKSLGPYLTSNVGKTQPMYSNKWQDYTASLTPGEQDAINRNARLSALGEQGLEPLLKGTFPEEYYQNSIYAPLKKQFQEDIQPALEEQYAGSGGYWGSARAGAVGKGYRDLYDTLANKRAELGWQAQQNIQNAIGAANSLTATETATQGIPRLIQQYGMDQLYNEWKRTRPEEQANLLNTAINFLNLSSATTTYTPGQKGAIGDIMSLVGAGIGTIVAPGIGTSIGAQLGGSVGGMFDKSGNSTGNLSTSLSNAGMNYALLNALKNNSSTNTNYSNYSIPSYTPMGSLGSNYQTSQLNALNQMGNYKFAGYR